MATCRVHVPPDLFWEMKLLGQSCVAYLEEFSPLNYIYKVRCQSTEFLHTSAALTIVIVQCFKVNGHQKGLFQGKFRLS